VYNRQEVMVVLSDIKDMNIELFKGIESADMGAMLSCTGYHIGNYARGQVIALENEHIRHVGIVLSGAVDMVKEDVWGNKTLLARTGRGELFGESFACAADNQSLVTFSAPEQTRVLFIPFHRIMHTCSMACEFHHRLVENMVSIIAGKNRELMKKVEVVSRKTLREKILAYLSHQSQREGERYFSIPLSRQELAEYLCADRTALSRELASMKNDGIIDYDKNMFRIL